MAETQPSICKYMFQNGKLQGKVCGKSCRKQYYFGDQQEYRCGTHNPNLLIKNRANAIKYYEKNKEDPIKSQIGKIDGKISRLIRLDSAEHDVALSPTDRIDFKWFLEACKTQRNSCYLCKTPKEITQLSEFLVDRKDSQKPYIKDNCHLICTCKEKNKTSMEFELLTQYIKEVSLK
jgi:hypothetical protein